MESKLIGKIKEMRAFKKGLKANIVKWGKELCEDESFQASDGWFDRFKKRAKLFLRVATHIVQQLKANYQIEIIL